MTESKYKKIQVFFTKHLFLLKILKILYNVLPIAVFIFYVPIAVYFTIKIKENPIDDFLKIVLVPAVVFVMVTIFRKLFNFKRPYEKLNITPLIVKNKKGQSFPSRHVASSFIISMAFMYINFVVGTVFLIFSLIIALTRVLAGVHFTRDVIVGAMFSIIIGLFFIFLI